MNKAAICRGLGAVLLAAAAAQAQMVGAGARAVVASETLPVYANMSSSGAAKVTLQRGDPVVIGLVLFDNDTTWCAISKPGETRRLGWASCEFLEPDRSPTPAAAAPPEPKPREIPPPAPPVVTPAPVATPAPIVTPPPK